MKITTFKIRPNELEMYNNTHTHTEKSSKPVNMDTEMQLFDMLSHNNDT